MAREYDNIENYSFQFGFDNVILSVSRRDILDCYSLGGVESMLQAKYQAGGGKV